MGRRKILDLGNVPQDPENTIRVLSRKKKPDSLALKEAELRREKVMAEEEKKVLERKAENIRMKREIEGAEEDDEALDPNDLGLLDKNFDERPGTSAVVEKIEAIAEELDPTAKFHVWRVDNGKKFKVGDWPITEWPDRMEEVARTAGGGYFLIIFKNEHGDEVRRVTQAFDPKFYGKPDNPMEGLTGVLAAMQQQTTAMIQASRQDMMEMMKIMLNSQGGNKGFLNTAQDLALLGEIFSRKSGGGSDAGGSVELFLKGLEMGRNLNAGAEPPSTFDKLVETVGKPLVSVLEKSANRGAGPTAPAATPAPTEPKAVFPKLAEPTPDAEEANMDDVKAVKRHPLYNYYVPQLVNAARLKEPVAKWAEKVLGLVPEAYDAMLLDVVGRDDMIAYLSKFEPAIGKEAVLSDWFKALAEAILAQYDADGGESAATEVVENHAPPIEVK